MSPTSNSTKFGMALAGGQTVLRTCLKLESGDSLSLFVDETAEPVADALICAAEEFDILVRRQFSPFQTQISFDDSRGLSPDEHEALAFGTAILTCVSSDARTTRYRQALIRAGTT